jgi:hypothetical protein
MALKFQVESLEGIEDNLHSLYREDNGKYTLDVEGVKPISEVERVQKALDSERKSSKTYKDQYSAWESKFPSKTPDEIAALVEQIPLLELESKGKVDPKKHQEVVESTVKSRLAPYELEINKLKQATAERDQIIEQFKSADRRRTIHDAVREVAAKEGFQESAYSNPEGGLMLLAERHLTVNSIGQVVVSDESKAYTPGLAVREALAEIKQHHPYLLKQSVGGGASGSNGSASGGPNPFRTNNITERMKYIKANEHSPDKWQAAMKQAGLSEPTQEYKPRG